MSDAERRKETYLGDGLYASFDGWMIILRAPREHGDHWVGLDGTTLKAFMEFVDKVKAGSVNQ